MLRMQTRLTDGQTETKRVEERDKKRNEKTEVVYMHTYNSTFYTKD